MDTMLKLNCPYCGAKLTFSLFSNKATCNYCGQESLISGIITKQSNCPVCQDKDQVQRVSALMQTNDPVAQHVRAPERPKIQSFTEFCANKDLPLTQIPKRDFQEKSKGPYTLYGIFCIILMIILFSNIGTSEGASKGILIFFAVIFLGLAVFLFSLAHKRANLNKIDLEINEKAYQQSLQTYLAEKEKQEDELHEEYEKMAKGIIDRWQLAMKRWEMLYYCHRDHIIYIPGSGKYEELKDILKYLYSQEL